MSNRATIQSFRRQHAVYEKRAARAFYLAIRAQIRKFVLSGSEDVTTIGAEPVTKAFQRVWRTIGVDYASKKYAEMLREEGGKGFTPEMKTKDGETDPDFTSLIDEYLKLHGAKKIVSITETTRNWVREQLSKGHAEGLLYRDIARRMINDEINASRAMLIARTESTGAMNFATFLPATKSNFLKEKNWIDSNDARIRPAGHPSPFDHHHEDIANQPLEKPFFTGGEELMFPGDTSLGASAGNVCNCRCTMGLKTLRDANGRMMRKPPAYAQPAMIQQLELHSQVSGQSLNTVVNGLLGAALGSLVGSVENLISNALQ